MESSENPKQPNKPEQLNKVILAEQNEQLEIIEIKQIFDDITSGSFVIQRYALVKEIPTKGGFSTNELFYHSLQDTLQGRAVSSAVSDLGRKYLDEKNYNDVFYERKRLYERRYEDRLKDVMRKLKEGIDPEQEGRKTLKGKPMKHNIEPGLKEAANYYLEMSRVATQRRIRN